MSRKKNGYASFVKKLLAKNDHPDNMVRKGQADSSQKKLIRLIRILVVGPSFSDKTYLRKKGEICW